MASNTNSCHQFHINFNHYKHLSDIYLEATKSSLCGRMIQAYSDTPWQSFSGHLPMLHPAGLVLVACILADPEQSPHTVSTMPEIQLYRYLCSCFNTMNRISSCAWSYEGIVYARVYILLQALTLRIERALATLALTASTFQGQPQGHWGQLIGHG